MEQRTGELGQAEWVDDGTKERLQAQNREELKVKQELRRTRRKQKPTRFFQSESEGEQLKKVANTVARKVLAENQPKRPSRTAHTSEVSRWFGENGV